jgi:hypothetical protein
MGLGMKRGGMVRIFIDNNEIAPPDDCSSISSILKYVDEAHLAENSAVRHIQVNGRLLTPNNLPGSAQNVTPHRLENPDKVELFTGNIAEIARGSISEVLDYLERIETLTPSLVKIVRTDPSPDSFRNVRLLYEGLYWMDLLFDKLKADFPVHLEAAQLGKGLEPECCRKSVATLKRLEESQEGGDFTRVSDLLEREILPFVPLWREMLIAMAQKVPGMQ